VSGIVNSRWRWFYAEASCSSHLWHRGFVTGEIWLGPLLSWRLVYSGTMTTGQGARRSMYWVTLPGSMDVALWLASTMSWALTSRATSTRDRPANPATGRSATSPACSPSALTTASRRADSTPVPTSEENSSGPVIPPAAVPMA
jgi:hypothetical protein